MNIVSRLNYKCVCTVKFKHAYKVHIYIHRQIHYISVVSVHTMLRSPLKRLAELYVHMRRKLIR